VLHSQYSLLPERYLSPRTPPKGKFARETDRDLHRGEHINKQRSIIVQNMNTRMLAQTVCAAEMIELI
jgi:hypothetical protein